MNTGLPWPGPSRQATADKGWSADRQSSGGNPRSAERLLLAGCLSLYALIVIFGSLSVNHEQQYVFLAESFLDRKLYFVSMPEHWNDTAAYAGRHYWPLGPLPAVLLMPFVFLWRFAGANFYQGYVSLPLSLLTCWLCFRLVRNCGRSAVESAWLVLAFCGASSYVGVAAISMSWSLAQVIAILLLFLAVYEWLGRRRWWLIGLWLGLTTTARVSAGLNIALFMGATLFCETKEKVKAFLRLTTGFAIPVLLLAAYNFARFGSFIETGYGYQPPAPQDFAASSLANVLPHLRIFLLGMPEVLDRFPFVATDPLGMSVLLLSPWLLYLGSLKMDRFNYLALANCALVLVGVLAWRSTGQLQLGYRFSLDFLPIIMLLLARSGFTGKEMSLGFKTLTVIGFLSTLFFLVSFIGLIPQG